jgi:LacI family transcriptional regulator
MTVGVRRKKTARFLEIAQAAGVSSSTVDRVLNERGSVSAGARERVVAAAKQLGVPRVLPQTQHGLIHLDVLLPANKTPFFLRLNVALQRSIEMLDRRIVVHRSFLPEHRNDLIAEAILKPPYRRQGLILAAPDTEPVRAALRQVTARGEAAVAVVTNIREVPELNYAGIDNYRAGRMAGYFMGHLARRGGRVVVLSSRTDYQGHVDRTTGCREVLERFAPRLVCDMRNVETYDDPDRCYLAVASALRSGEPIAGIYNSGAGSPGIESALRKFNAAEVCWITHEMSDDHRQYMRAGLLDMVIDQDPDNQVITALQHLLFKCGVVENDALAGERSEFRLYFVENIRETPYLPPYAEAG